MAIYYNLGWVRVSLIVATTKLLQIIIIAVADGSRWMDLFCLHMPLQVAASLRVQFLTTWWHNGDRRQLLHCVQ
jgi:hypothetical protein